jgi:predicted SAM-dependent methyltransferase
MMRINLGCGQTPTKGWKNFDNSLSLRLSNNLLLSTILYRLALLERSQFEFIRFARAHSIEYGDATKGLPVPPGSVDVLYSSHMLEHLDQKDAEAFLMEAIRVLRAGGIIRIAVPDLRKKVQQYFESNDADAFMSSSYLSQPRPRTIAQRIKMLLVGPRHHQWMYDEISLSRLLLSHGFSDPKVLKAGESTIDNPQDLDLSERASETLYIEAKKPL